MAERAEMLYSLKWQDHLEDLLSSFKKAIATQTVADVTIACDGQSLKAHKVILAACSSFLETLLAENPCEHPIIIIAFVKFSELKAIIEFMYHGEINVPPDQLRGVIKAAEALKVKVLGEVSIAEPNGSGGQQQSGDQQQQSGDQKQQSSEQQQQSGDQEQQSGDQQQQSSDQQQQSSDQQQQSSDQQQQSSDKSFCTIRIPFPRQNKDGISSEATDDQSDSKIPTPMFQDLLTETEIKKSDSDIEDMDICAVQSTSPNVILQTHGTNSCNKSQQQQSDDEEIDVKCSPFMRQSLSITNFRLQSSPPSNMEPSQMSTGPSSSNIPAHQQQKLLIQEGTPKQEKTPPKGLFGVSYSEGFSVETPKKRYILKRRGLGELAIQRDLSGDESGSGSGSMNKSDIELKIGPKNKEKDQLSIQELKNRCRKLNLIQDKP